MEVYVRKRYTHTHTCAHLRLVKFESLADKQGKMPFMQLDMSLEIKGEFGAGDTQLGVTSI